jgi:hypothetical protein
VGFGLPAAAKNIGASIPSRIVSFNKAKNKFVVLLWSSSLVEDQAMALMGWWTGLADG